MQHQPTNQLPHQTPSHCSTTIKQSLQYNNQTIMATLQEKALLKKKNLWNENHIRGVLAIIEEKAFKKAKKRAWEHLDLLGLDLDGMFPYTSVDAINLMWDLVLEGRNNAENVEAGGDKTEISAAEGTSSETMDGEGMNKIFVSLLMY